MLCCLHILLFWYFILPTCQFVQKDIFLPAWQRKQEKQELQMELERQFERIYVTSGKIQANSEQSTRNVCRLHLR